MNIIIAITLATISLQDIDKPELQDQTVEIRGFLHRMPEGEWILSSLPNVRSCCTGAKHERLVIQGVISNPSKSKAVLIRGKLVKKGDHYELIEPMILP